MLHQAVEKRSERAEIAVEKRTRTNGTQSTAASESARAGVVQPSAKLTAS